MGAGESTRGISLGRFGETRRSPQISQNGRDGWFRNVQRGHANVASSCGAAADVRVVSEYVLGSPPGAEEGYSVDSDESGVGDRGGCWNELSSTAAGGRIPHAKQGGIAPGAVTAGV
jgi:hypothetical protein